MNPADSYVGASTDAGKVDRHEIETRSAEELEEEIADLFVHIDAATYRLLRAIGELDRREEWATGFQSTALWRALLSRDRTCQFPGCHRTTHLQAHHVEHWAKGGQTNPENLILLCRTHHWAVHEGGFRVDGRTPQGFAFLWPDGSAMPVSPPRSPINGEAGETLREANRTVGLDISSETVDTFWDGEGPDYSMAVDALLSYDTNLPMRNDREEDRCLSE